MRLSSSVGAVILLALSQGSYASTAVGTPAPPDSISIRDDGSVAIRGDAGPGTSASSNDLDKDQVSCRWVSRTWTDTTAIVIRSASGARYGTFMRVANWLEDCRHYSLRITGEIGAGSAARSVDVNLEMLRPDEIMRIAGPACMSIAPTSSAPSTCGPRPKPSTYISLQGDGSIFVSTDGATMKRSTLGELSRDLPLSLGSADPTRERVLLRADANATYTQFLILLEQLDRDGYRRLGLINEQF